ncbi:hypothetical protein ACQZVD_000791 [Vibrio parahaemolyticus]
MKNKSTFSSNANYFDLLKSVSDSKFASFDLKFFDNALATDILRGSNSSTSIRKTSSSSLNHKNDQPFDADTYAEIIRDMLITDDYVPGESSKTGLYLENLYRKDIVIFRDSFQKAWLELYRHNEHHIANFICIASSLEYEMLEDRADALIIAGYGHVSPLVNEAVIRAVEMWEQEKHIDYLTNMRPTNIAWLDKYKDSVIQDLKLGL